MTTMTPLEHYPELAEALGLGDLYFKREDLHPYGSHKGRSIPFMIDHYVLENETNFAISSSGNAALAAALHVRKLNDSSKRRISLDIFVGNNIAKPKLAKLQELAGENIRVLIKERPRQALGEAVEAGARSLRQSTDDVALLGYESLAEEISELGGVGAVFIGTSSATTAQALGKYFIDNRLPIQVHVVQTSSCHPISDEFETFDVPPEQSSADAIVDRTGLRKKSVVPIIKKTGGRGWLATNDNILAAQSLTEKHTGLQISSNSALALVGAMQAAYMGYAITGSVICIITGR